MFRWKFKWFHVSNWYKNKNNLIWFEIYNPPGYFINYILPLLYQKPYKRNIFKSKIKNLQFHVFCPCVLFHQSLYICFIIPHYLIRHLIPLSFQGFYFIVFYFLCCFLTAKSQISFADKIFHFFLFPLNLIEGILGYGMSIKFIHDFKDYND